MSKIDLKQFCNKEEFRRTLVEPFSFGEFTYATNGHIMVRVDRRADTADANEDQQKTVKAAEKILTKASAQTVSPIPFQIPPAPRDETCRSCNGSGLPDHHNCPCCTCEECEECEGTGTITERQAIRFDGFDLNADYLRMIAALPGVKINLTAPNDLRFEPLFFTFSGGIGALMTMRQENYAGYEVIPVTELDAKAA